MKTTKHTIKDAGKSIMNALTFTRTKKPLEAAITDDLSDTASISSDNSGHIKNNDKPKVRANLKKVISVLANRPNLFASALDVAEGKLSSFFNLTEIRAELTSLGYSVAKRRGRISILFKNGLLEELSNIKEDQVIPILNEVFKHKFITKQKKEFGLDILDNQTIVENLTALIKLTKTLGSNELSSKLSELIYNQEKLKTSTPPEKEQLSMLDNASDIAKILVIALGDKKSQESTMEFIENVAPTIATLLDQKNSPLSLSIRSSLTLTSEAKFSELIPLGIPVIEEALKRTEELQEVIELASQGTLTPELVVAGINLFNSKEILEHIVDLGKFNTVNGAFENNIETFAGSIVDTFKKEGMLDAVMGESLKSITDKILDLPKTHEILGVNQEEANRYKLLAPDLIDYAKGIAQAAIKHPEDLKDIAKSLKEYKDSTDKDTKLTNLNILVDKAIRLTNNPDVILALFDETNLSKVLKHTEIFKEELAPLSAALKISIPKFITIIKQGKNNLSKSTSFQELTSKALNLFGNSNEEKKPGEIKKLGIEMIDLFIKDKDMLGEIKGVIVENKKDFIDLIDKSLAVVKKDNNLKLKLLKPFGINGELITSLIERSTNEKGLTAIKELLDNPGIFNALTVISASENRGFVIGHIVKSTMKYITHSVTRKTENILSSASQVLGEWTKKLKYQQISPNIQNRST